MHIPTRWVLMPLPLMRTVTAAGAGKLAAVHNGGGRVVWAVDFGRRPDGVHTVATAQLLPWRSSHDVQHAPEVTDACPGPSLGSPPSETRQQAAHRIMDVRPEDYIVEIDQLTPGAWCTRLLNVEALCRRCWCSCGRAAARPWPPR
jgi:hypothetical protein